MLKKNCIYLCQHSNMSRVLLGVFFQLSLLAEPNTNAILAPPIKGYKKGRGYATISSLAAYLRVNRTSMIDYMNDLSAQGLIHPYYTDENLQQLINTGSLRSERVYFINAELIYTGYQDEIPAAVCLITTQRDLLEKKRILLPYKIYYSTGADYGSFYSRKVWLQKTKADIILPNPLL